MQAKKTRVEILSQELMGPPIFAGTLRKSLVTQGKASFISLHCGNLKGFNLSYHCSEQFVMEGQGFALLEIRNQPLPPLQSNSLWQPRLFG